FSLPASDRAMRSRKSLVEGNFGRGVPRAEAVKSKAELRSPHTERRHSLIFGSRTPKHFSMKRITDVWSNSSEQTYPPRLQGDTTIAGARMPRPIGCLPGSNTLSPL